MNGPLVLVPLPTTYTTTVVEGVTYVLMEPEVLRRALSALSPAPALKQTGSVVAWRHKCAASNFHDHDGCSCTDEELRQRYASEPITAQKDR